MALAADREYMTTGPTVVLEDGLYAGAADTLYKGAILCVGADGYVCVPSDGANLIPLGLAKKQIVAAGSNAEIVPIETGIVSVKKVSQHQTTVVCGAGGTSNVNYDGAYFLISEGLTTYFVWCDVNSGSTSPAALGGPLYGLGYTGIEVDIGTTTATGDIALAIETAVEAATTIEVTVASSTCTLLALTKGYSIPSDDEGDSVPFTVTNARYSEVVRADVGEFFWAIADDGVVYSTEKSTITACLGMCKGVDLTKQILFIDTRLKDSD